MVDRKGSLFVLVMLLFVATPIAQAAAPSPDARTAYGLDGQDASGFAVSPVEAGRERVVYGAFVPVFTSPKLTLPGQPRVNDLYLCELGGNGCTSYRHETATGSNGAAQVADAIAYFQPDGITARYAIGGPGAYVSMWSNLGKPLWTRQVLGDSTVIDVAIDPRQAEYVVAAGTSTIGSGNRVSVFEGSTGRLRWDHNVTAEDGSTSDVRTTSIDYARDTHLVVVGTTRGILLLNPSGAKPVNAAATVPLDVGSVSEVEVSRSGGAVLARTSRDLNYIPLRPDASGTLKPAVPYWSTPLPSPTAMAMSADGERFAAASGTKIFFYRHLNTSLLAQEVGTPFDAGASVTGLSYDAKGGLLVASAGNFVYGFGPQSNEPIWKFDATAGTAGGLDGPLRGVEVSDSGARITVVGKTKVMSYGTEALARIVPAGAATLPATPGARVTAQFRVVNEGSLPDNYTLLAQAPIDWQPEVETASFSLAPDGARVVNASVTVPAGAPPASYALSLQLRSQARGDIVVSTASVNLTVPRTVALEVDVEPLRVEMSAGETREVPIVVRNLGNAEGLVNLTATQTVSGGPSWQIRFQPQQLRIGATDAATTTMIVTSPADGASGERNTVIVVAREGTTVEARDNLSLFIDPEFLVDVATGSAVIELPPGESRTFTFNVTNRGNTEDLYNLTANVTPVNQVGDWSVRISDDQLRIPFGQTRLVTVTIRPAVAEPREDAVLVLKAVSVGSGETVQDTANVALIMKPREETPQDRLLPLPPLALVLAMVALAAVARRFRRGSS